MTWHFRDGLDPAPFVEFIVQTREKFDGNNSAAADYLGVSETAVRRWAKGMTSDGEVLVAVREREVDRVCTHAGVPLSLLYPQPEDDEPWFDHFCANCEEWTVTGRDRVCLWCVDEPVARPRGVANICPGCNGHKSHCAKLCRDCRSLDPPRRKPANVSAEVLEDARRMWRGGMSLRRVAYQIFERTTYRNPEACYGSLRSIARRDWKREPVAA